MKFNKDELFILQEVVDYHCDLVLNDEEDHGVYQVHTLYKLVKLMNKKRKAMEKENGWCSVYNLR